MIFLGKGEKFVLELLVTANFFSKPMAQIVKILYCRNSVSSKNCGRLAYVLPSLRPVDENIFSPSSKFVMATAC